MWTCPVEMCAVHVWVHAGSNVHDLGVALILKQWFACGPYWHGGGCATAAGDLYFFHAPLALAIAHPNPSPSVNELEEQLQAVCCWRGACVLVKGWWLCVGGVAPSTQEVSRAIVLGMWWNGTDVILCVLMLSRLCCVSGHTCGLTVGFRWSVKFSLRMVILEEQDGVVFGVSWPLA